MPRVATASRSDDRIAARPFEPAVVDVRGRFARSARLPGSSEFDRCLRQAPFVRQGAFALHLLPVAVSPEGVAAWRLGLVIPKRYEASAVARNTIKRRWREAFRSERDRWATEFGSGDLVVRLQGPLVPRAPKSRRPAAGTAGSSMPALLRGRDTFDPHALLGMAFERLRARTQPAATA